MNKATTTHTVRLAASADFPALRELFAAQTTLGDGPSSRVLVATDARGQLLAGLCLQGGVGMTAPRHWLRLGLVVHAAAELKLYSQQTTLLLGNDLTGAAEITAWGCWRGNSPEPTGHQALVDLVHEAQRVVRTEPEHFGNRLIVQLPGLRDETGTSPFWQGLGRHFYRGDPAQAAVHHGAAWRSHVAALLPRNLVYASFLPPAAQAAIGQADPALAAQRFAFESAGLRWRQHIAIDDAGPTLEWSIDD